MGEYIGKQLGVNMIIENLAGSANMVALNSYMSRPHDGYTLVMIASSDTPWVYERTKPDVQFTGDDFYALGRMTNSIAGMGFITAAGRFKDWPAFVDYCKEKGDGEVNIGVIGPDRLDDLQIDEYEKICGVKFNRIYYSGSSDVQTDVLTGDVDVGYIGCNRVSFVQNTAFQILCLNGDGVPADYPVQGQAMLSDYEDLYGFDYERISCTASSQRRYLSPGPQRRGSRDQEDADRRHACCQR
jgi:tripartite-type tricarboxylate transporter receptor subunit TctC